VALPKVGVSTPQAFRDLDAKMAVAAPLLTSDAPVDKIEKLSRVLSGVFTHAEDSSPTGIVLPGLVSGTNQNDLAEKTLLALVRTGIENDFEEVAFSQHPFLRDIKRQLMGSDPAGNGNGLALYAALSGSGSALFGLYRSQADAAAAQQRVQQAGTQAILTETLPRQAYWERMFAE
jgi:4-diphosphocytidyl-2-C-methyl-D-erythritol kinase